MKFVKESLDVNEQAEQREARKGKSTQNVLKCVFLCSLACSLGRG